MTDEELFDRIQAIDDTISMAMADVDFVRNNPVVLAAAIIADAIDRLARQPV